MNIPTKQQCFQLIHKMATFDHIAAHSFQVCRVALLITNQLNNGKNFLNPSLVQASAMLHDITKTRSIKTGEMHAETGGQLLQKLGYPEVADIVRQHVRLDDFQESEPVTETEIVNYADKRVIHDKITILEDRMKYIMERYGTIPEYRQRLKKVWETAIAQEEKIFKNIDFHADDLINFIIPHDCSAEMKKYKKTCG